MKKQWTILLFLLRLLLLLMTAKALPSDQKSEQVGNLMLFKQSSVKSDPNGFLATWNFNSSTPCSWRGISCTGNGTVTAVDLTGASITGDLHLPYLAGGIPNLHRLSLGDNFFFAANLSAGYSFPCVLEILDLSSNKLANPIPENSILRDCNRLKLVNLSGNSIPGGRGSFPSLPSLQQLDVSRNTISDFWLLSAVLSNCLSLNFLNFSANSLKGELRVPSLASCKNLTIVDFSCNLLSGSIPWNLTADSSIRVLNLSQNNFTGELFEIQFGHSLFVIDFSHNRLSGSAFHASLANCHLLETLDLSHNGLDGSIPGDVLGSLKGLKKLILGGNHFMGEIPSSLAHACGSLTELDLSGNKLIGELPLQFESCSLLQGLNLGRNGLSGDFLSTVVSKLGSLKFLNAPFNNLSGSVPLALTNCSNLQVLDLSSNAFSGKFPSRFCSKSAFTALERLILANNFISGSIPSVLGRCRNLRSIDLSLNDLQGRIPLEIISLPKITDLVMWANNISGEIPHDICINGGNLETLILNNNLLTGTIPPSISKCTNMIWMSISGNHLTGTIPPGIGNLLNLAILQMGNNSLTGKIPPEVRNCRSLIWLDLNSNNLMGDLPGELAAHSGLVMPGKVSGKEFAFVRNEGGTSCRGAGGLVESEGISAAKLQSLPMVYSSCSFTRIYSGSLFYTFDKNGSMIYLDLSYNSFSGIIPRKYGAMKYLHVLNLGHNKLTGTIPESLGDLKAVGALDLSHNNLQGSIPGSLGTLSFLSDFDASNNNLSGAIPSGGQLTTFPSSRYANNSGLCNLPLDPCGSSSQSRSSSETYKHEGKNHWFEIYIIVGIAVFILCVVGLGVALYRIKKKLREDCIANITTSANSIWNGPFINVRDPLSINVATFEKPLQKLTFAHLLEATNGFSPQSLIGSGGFGEVYKAHLKDGHIVAIKKLIHSTGQGDREFMAEMETIGKIKHRNLVPLLGYCKIGEERLLVYDYMTWGSLEDVLHVDQVIDWSTRKKIAIGSARGLAFLHHNCIPRIIHRDMKSSNVLLDENLEARLSDFGMARLVSTLDTHLSVSTLVGTPGYVPPEYYQSFRCTTKGDVYSYGVILLELLSGKRPIDTLVFGEDTNLVGWAKLLQREKKGMDIFDRRLMNTDCEESELLEYLRIAFECLEDRPFRRPTMIQVMSMFKEVWDDSESDIL